MSEVMRWTVPRPHFIERADVYSADDHVAVVLASTRDAVVKERDELKSVLEAVRSQMCWERDRDQLTMGFKDLHDDVTKVLGRDET